VNFAVVIGIDDYGSGAPPLDAAVSDALRFTDWVLASGRGNVQPANLRLLLGLGAQSPTPPYEHRPATKDEIVTAINEIVSASTGQADCLWFYFAGHGITARVSNRDESAIVTPGFDEVHPDHSLAVRSLTEYFETTQFRDQIFFIDACRDVPWKDREYEIGRWPIPRRREPGQPPAQQFILQATAPLRTAAEVGWPGEAVGAFTDVLMEGLNGKDNAKAWSWERTCYEVRWEKLATYIRDAMKLRQVETRPTGESAPEGGWPIQIPQDSGVRGVEDRDRDAVLAAFPRNAFGTVELTVNLTTDVTYDEADVSVVDSVGDPVASVVKLTGTSHRFTLPPKTYAVRATTTTPAERIGRLKAPIDLYGNEETTIKLQSPDGEAAAGTKDLTEADLAAAGNEQPPGTIEIRAHDPLAVAEIRDEAGRVITLAAAGTEYTTPPGFYRVRYIGPEEPGSEQFVALTAGEREPVELVAPAPSAFACRLAQSFGGSCDEHHVVAVPGGDPIAWARPSTVVAAWVGAAQLDAIGAGDAGVAFHVVPADGDRSALEGLVVRIWPAGDVVRDETAPLTISPAGVGSVVLPVSKPQPHWLSIERGADAAVLALPVLPGRVATVIAEVDAGATRLYQFHPAASAGPSSTPQQLRRLEYLQRLLLSGRVDGARRLAEDVADAAADDPFGACVAAYVLLRLGAFDRVAKAAVAVAAAAPTLSDAFVLRAECEAHAGNLEASTQAFTDAVAVGVPAFGEGLTRLLEGMRAIGVVHPRGALVRHIFQRHARGSMWSLFNPARPLEPGRLVISSVDLGFEA